MPVLGEYMKGSMEYRYNNDEDFSDIYRGGHITLHYKKGGG